MQTFTLVMFRQIHAAASQMYRDFFFPNVFFFFTCTRLKTEMVRLPFALEEMKPNAPRSFKVHLSQHAGKSYIKFS